MAEGENREREKVRRSESWDAGRRSLGCLGCRLKTIRRKSEFSDFILSAFSLNTFGLLFPVSVAPVGSVRDIKKSRVGCAHHIC